jgi:hypothetical protein
VKKKNPLRSEIGNTFTERDYWLVWAAIKARIDARKLLIHDAHELRVARRLSAVWCRGYDAAADVVSVARVLAICDSCCDERLPIYDTRGLGEIDHLVRNVLLVTDAARGKKRVDARQTCELHARLVREYITAAV